MEELSLNILDIAQNSVRGKRHPSCDITVAELTRPKHRLVITITDNGCGMDPRDRSRHVDGPVLHHPYHPQGGVGRSLFSRWPH